MELWKNFDRLVVFDTETTGIEFGRDRIIEIGAVALENGAERGNFNALVRLPAGQMLPPFITELTGITDEQLNREGVDDRTAAEGFCRLLEGAEHPLLVAYNAQFDLNFLYYLLQPLGLVSVLRKPRFLDALTVYRDRRVQRHRSLRSDGGGKQPPGGGRRPGHRPAFGGDGGGEGRSDAVYRPVRHPSQVRHEREKDCLRDLQPTAL